VAAKLGLVVDCLDPDRLGAFWAEALGYVQAGSAGSYALLLPAAGDGPKLLLQRVPEAKAGKNRVHFDIDAADIEAEAARLGGLGAHRVSDAPMSEHGTSWIVLADPEGNEFCVCDGGAT
jgi:predicted enzyme related to lactoylglutathione lyase